MKKFALFSLLLFVCASCPGADEPIDSSIVIKNFSSEDIIYYLIGTEGKDTSLAFLPHPLIPEHAAHITLKPNEESVYKD
jgi:hypothetical protein